MITFFSMAEHQWFYSCAGLLLIITVLDESKGSDHPILEGQHSAIHECNSCIRGTDKENGVCVCVCVCVCGHNNICILKKKRNSDLL